MTCRALASALHGLSAERQVFLHRPGAGLAKGRARHQRHMRTNAQHLSTGYDVSLLYGNDVFAALQHSLVRDTFSYVCHVTIRYSPKDLV